MRIESGLDRPLHAQHRRGLFLSKTVAFQQPDSMLTGHGPTQREGFGDDFFKSRLGAPALVGVTGVIAILGGVLFIYITLGSLLFGRRLDAGVSSPKFTPVGRAAPTAAVQSYGSIGFTAPGTFALAMVFLVAFVLYYFINWKYLSTLWGLS